MITYNKPAMITGTNDERFATEAEAIECAEWMENECDGDCELYVFERNGEWVVAW